jgi:hypothetical protein
MGQGRRQTAGWWRLLFGFHPLIGLRSGWQVCNSELAIAHRSRSWQPACSR